jgi:hypothetical protein
MANWPTEDRQPDADDRYTLERRLESYWIVRMIDGPRSGKCSVRHVDEVDADIIRGVCVK